MALEQGDAALSFGLDFELSRHLAFAGTRRISRLALRDHWSKERIRREAVMGGDRADNQIG